MNNTQSFIPARVFNIVCKSDDADAAGAVLENRINPFKGYDMLLKGACLFSSNPIKWNLNSGYVCRSKTAGTFMFLL